MQQKEHGKISSTTTSSSHAEPQGEIGFRSYHDMKPCHLLRNVLGRPSRLLANPLRAVRRLAPPPRDFTPSAEQLEVVRLSRIQNVVVTARPGAGKTATARAIVAENPGLRILVLTYSKRLQLETKERLHEYPNVDVYTFHANAQRLFGVVANNDAVLDRLRRERQVPVWNDAPYDIVVLDEIQDCTQVLFWLNCCTIMAMMHAHGSPPRLVVLGDEKQTIFEFRGADARYLTLAPDIMATLTPYLWSHRTLSNSFRLSVQSAAFVNKAFLGGLEYIQGSHVCSKPIYLHTRAWEGERLVKVLLPLIKKYGAENTAVLAPSVQKRGVISRLTNALTQFHRVPVAVPLSDDMPLDDRVVRGKLCVSTTHQFKGNERDLVIVYNMDNSFFEYYGREREQDTCPNELFVALTRARKQLVVIHQEKAPALPFLSVPAVHDFGSYLNTGVEPLRPNTRSQRRPHYGLKLPLTMPVSTMSKHIPDEALHRLVTAHLDIAQTAAPLPEHSHIKAPDVIVSDRVRGHHEAVCDLNGIAVVAAYEYSTRKTLNGLGSIAAGTRRVPSGDKRAIWFSKKACEYDASITSYKSRHLQLRHHAFDWLVPHLDAATERLRSYVRISRNLQFEAPLATPLKIGCEPTTLTGQADIVKPGRGKRPATIFEIKLVAQLSYEHALQIATYGYLWASQPGLDSLPEMKLFNVRNGEEWTITVKNGVGGAETLISEILKEKYTAKKRISAEDFVRRCKEVVEEVESLWT